MINIKSILTEKRDKSITHGALMAMFPKEICKKIIKFNERIITEDILYKEGDEYGRELECHTTIKYGFTKDLNELQIRNILKDVKPFNIRLYALDKFENEKFDVIILKVESDVLKRLNSKSNDYPNEDEYPTYLPHSTLAYVKKGTFLFKKDDINIVVPISSVMYSPIQGDKFCYNL